MLLGALARSRLHVPPPAEPARARVVPPSDSAPLPATQATISPAGEALRAQAIRYELFANDGRYCSNARVAVFGDDNKPRPMHYAVIPADDVNKVRFFGPASDPATTALWNKLRCELPDPKTGQPRTVVLLPVHWEEAQTLRKQVPGLTFVTDGQVHRTASPRSLLFGVARGQAPSRLAGLEGYSIKLHLSDETYERLGGLSGSRELNFNDSKMATVITHALERLKPVLSPYFEIQREAQAVAAEIGVGKQARQVGALFRELPRTPTIPAFALYSKTTERLPHVENKMPAVFRTSRQQRYLGVDAVERYREKHPGVRKDEAFLKLFVDPLYDVLFSMAAQGWTMELHAQNFSFEFDAKTGETQKLHVRDLHGTGYDKTYRAARGKDDVLSVEALKAEFPDISQADLDAYFLRHGQVRSRYKAPGMFETTLDFHSAIFLYHMVRAMVDGKLFSKDEATALVERIKDRLEHFAHKWDFDLSKLKQPEASPNNTFWVAQDKGIRGRVLFRRPQPKAS